MDAGDHRFARVHHLRLQLCQAAEQARLALVRGRFQRSRPGPIANRLRRVACSSAFALLATACTEQPKADPSNAQQVAHGKRVYEAQCAACHGAKLEGQPNWRKRLPSGRLPAPPHDPSGHTWHHSDALLFSITKHGIERHAPPGYKSDMPAFGNRLSDHDIWAALAYIKSMWPEETRQWQAEVSREDAGARR